MSRSILSIWENKPKTFVKTVYSWSHSISEYETIGCDILILTRKYIGKKKIRHAVFDSVFYCPFFFSINVKSIRIEGPPIKNISVWKNLSLSTTSPQISCYLFCPQNIMIVHRNTSPKDKILFTFNARN